MSLMFTRNRYSRGKLTLLLAALLFLLAFALESHHHHNDGDSHADCSLCAAFHQARSASIQLPGMGSPVLERASLIVSPEAPVPILRYFVIPLIRPPPA